MDYCDELSSDKKKEKRMALLKRLIKEMDSMDGAGDLEPSHNQAEIAQESSESLDHEDKLPEADAQDGDEGLSKEEIASLFKEKNSLPKKEGGLMSVSNGSVKSKSYGNRFKKKKG